MARATMLERWGDAMPCRMTVIAAALAVSSNGMAAELAKSGTFEGRFYSHTVQKIEDLETADDMKAYVNESFGFHAGNQHGNFLDGTTERCVGFGSYSKAGAVREVGRCTSTDADGDKIFEEYEVQLSDAKDTTPGKAKFLGGTGKYTGLRATLTFTGENWPAISKADTMFAGSYKGEYSIGK
jgi:hypothetical protein